MIDPEHDLSIRKQAEVMDISRSTVYYEPRPISAEDLWLMRRIDELHLNYPFAGSRMLRDLLWQQGLEVGRRHIKTLMKKMGIEAIYRKPNTSKPAPEHRIYPYLLRGLAVSRPNQVWAMDLTYIPMARGFIWQRWRTGSAAGFLPGDCQSRWTLPSASRRSKKLFPRMKNQRYSTPIRAASLPAKRSPDS
jgi:putative transposase